MPNTFPDVHVTGAVHHWLRTRETLLHGLAPWYLGTAEVTPQMQLTQHYQECRMTPGGSALPFQRKYDGQSALVSVLLSRFSKQTDQLSRQVGLVAGAVPKKIVNPGGSGFGKSAPDPVARLAIATDNLFKDPDPGFTPPDPSAVFVGKGAGATGAPKQEPAKPGPGIDSPPASEPKVAVAYPGLGQESRWSRGSWVFGSRDFELWQVFEFALDGRSRSYDLEVGWYWPRVCLQDRTTIAAGTQAEKLLLVFDCQPMYLEQPDALQIVERETEFFTTDLSSGSLASGGGSLEAAFVETTLGIQRRIITPTGADRGWILYSNDPKAFPASIGVSQ